MAIGITASALGLRTATNGALGTLFVRLVADASNLVKGMATAQAAVAGSTATMSKQLANFAAGATTSFILVGAAAVREFAKFEQAMTKSTSIMGQMGVVMRKELEDTARSIGKESIFSARELAEAYFYLSSAGYSVQQSIKTLPIVSKFAQSGYFDLNKATTLLADSLAALGLKTNDPVKTMEQMVRVSDVLSRANIMANASVEEFADALTNKAANALRLANKEVEEGVAVLAAFAERGVKGRHAGEQLHMVLRDLQRTGLNFKEEFALMGVTVFDSSGAMRHMADILQDIEGAFAGMSVEQRRAALEMMGFQDRSLAALLALVGSSNAIREYERQLKQAGNTTDEVANKRMESFINQITITWRHLQDLLITIGEELVPGLRNFNEGLKEVVDWIIETQRTTGFLSAAFKTMGDVMKAAAYGGTILWVSLKHLYIVMSSGMNIQIQIMIIGVSAIIKLFGKWLEMTKGMIIGLIHLAKAAAGVSDVMTSMLKRDFSGAKEAFASMVGGTKNALTEIGASIKDGVLGSSDIAMDAIKQTTEMAKTTVKEGVSSIITDWETLRIMGEQWFAPATDSANKGIDSVVKNSKRLVEETSKATQVIANESARRNLEIYQASEKATKAMDELDIPKLGRFRSPFEGAIDPRIEDMMRSRDEVADAQDKLKKLEEIGKGEVELTKEVQERKLQAIEYYTQRSQQLQLVQYQMMFNSASSIFESMSEMSASFAGEQSDLFKAMFAASKAFAVAESIVKIQQGIASAASLPWPANLAAMASVAAATANIVTTIRSTRLLFEGERAKGGPVSQGRAYLVGEKGPELFVPSEGGDIVPNSDLGGGSVRVIVNNYTDARPEVRERREGSDRVIEVMIRKVKDEIGAEIREGRGSVTRALESSFSLRRGQQ